MTLRDRGPRVLIVSIGSLFAIIVLLYVSTLFAQAVSARRASKMLDALEALRIGDSALTLERVVPQCTLTQMEEMYRCEVFAGWGRWQWQGALARVPTKYSLPVTRGLRRLGIHPWYLSVYATIRDGKIRNLHLLALVISSRVSLGARWELNEKMPNRFISSSPTPDQTRTYIGEFSITSLPGGRGISIAVTPDSTPRELLSRQISRSCFQSFNRCDELCSLLPNAISVLDDRGEKWADCNGSSQ